MRAFAVIGQSQCCVTRGTGRPDGLSSFGHTHARPSVRSSSLRVWFMQLISITQTTSPRPGTDQTKQVVGLPNIISDVRTLTYRCTPAVGWAQVGLRRHPNTLTNVWRQHWRIKGESSSCPYNAKSPLVVQREAYGIFDEHSRTRWGSLLVLPRPSSWNKGRNGSDREEIGLLMPNYDVDPRVDISVVKLSPRRVMWTDLMRQLWETATTDRCSTSKVLYWKTASLRPLNLWFNIDF